MAAAGGDPEDDLERALGLAGLDGETAAGRAARERLEYRLAPLAGLLAPVEPGMDLFVRIAAAAGIDAPLAGFHVARRDEGVWETVAPGVETRTLWRSERSRRHAFLLRMQPGAAVPEHGHGGDEECLVIEGDMVVNGVEFRAGDFQVALAGTRHATVTTRGGCLCLISVAL
jgi:quercetin dioxygenase-like cupin family protein